MHSSTYKENENFAKELEDELMKFTKKDEDIKVETCLVEQTGELPRKVEVEVNITECTRSLGAKMFEGDYQDTTDSSSSFDGSDCDVDTFGDSELLPEFCDDAASTLDFSRFGEKFGIRKKRLTPHWRSYIQPLMWRCKWAELEMKKLQSLAEKYDHEIEAYNKKKEIQLENTKMEDGTKSLPFSVRSAGTNILKRKKRKRTEASTDVAKYMYHHNLFSYHDNKKPLPEHASTSNQSKNLAIQKVNIDNEFWVHDNQISIESSNGDNPLEHLLWRIGHLESRISSLKSRADKITRENAGSYITSQLISLGDTLVPECAVTCHGDAVPDPNETMNRTCFTTPRNVDDEVLIDNRRAKEEMDSFEEVKIPTIQKLSTHKDKEEINDIEEVKIHPIQNSPLVVNGSPSNPVEPELPADDQPPPKIRSIAKLTAPKGTRKKGRKKRSGRWGRRMTKTR